jgi:hypothetical protein
MVQATGDCEECGRGDAEMSADGRWLCAECAAAPDDGPSDATRVAAERRTADRRTAADRRSADRRTADRRSTDRRSTDRADVNLVAHDEPDGVSADALALVGLLVPGPGDDPLEVVIGGEAWTWADLGEAISETLLTGRGVELHLRPASGEPDSTEGFLGVGANLARPRLPEDDAVRAEAVALLADCLAHTDRHPRPPEALSAAAIGIRKGLDGEEPLWKLVVAGAGWSDGPPSDDNDLWLEAAFCLAAPRWRLPLPAEVVGCLASMELDDWIATVIELTRAGPGTPIDPQSLLVLAARCMDVDSGAVEPQSAALMRMAFEVVVPIWRAVGAVSDDGLLTALGAWGLPLALARAWGGSLDDR